MVQIPTSTLTATPASVPSIDFNAWARALGTDELELRGSVRIYGFQKTALMMGSPPLEALHSQQRTGTPVTA